jgi:hypothetical protein
MGKRSLSRGLGKCTWFCTLHSDCSSASDGRATPAYAYSRCVTRGSDVWKRSVVYYFMVPVMAHGTTGLHTLHSRPETPGIITMLFLTDHFGPCFLIRSPQGSVAWQSWRDLLWTGRYVILLLVRLMTISL